MARAVDLHYPFRGRWLTRNSPAHRVPSHGTSLLATAFAVDFVPVDASGRSAPVTLGALLRPEPPERFAGFGRPVPAPVDGMVVAAHDIEPDHEAFRGLPSVGYALTPAHGLTDAMGGELSVGSSGPGGTSMVLRLPPVDSTPP